MSLLDRLLRSMDTFSQIEQDSVDRGGMLGEAYAEAIIDGGQQGCYIRNPMIPHPTQRGLFLETDFLVYMQGNLYCVEIKNYRGQVYYPARYKTVFVKKGWFIFKRRVQQVVADGYDYTRLIQQKTGYRGEAPTVREMPNPLLKTQRYVDNLKRYLSRIDARLSVLPVYPVLAFAEKTDIRAIDNFDAGIMHISQLPAFFKKYGNPAYSHTSVSWIQQALQRLPTWDLVLTSRNEWLNGVLSGRDFSFKATDGHHYALPYAQIHTIEVAGGGTFSASDTLTVTYMNGKQQVFSCVSGEVHLKRFKGEEQIHKIRNMKKLVVGIANKGQ